jgi:energy-coupling factor transporter ATP-binding protein EcfA2
MGTITEGNDTDVAVEFRNATLAYRGSGEASLENISFVAKKGDTIGIIGGTGSGKSSLVNMIPAFYKATSGEVLVNGVNVGDINRAPAALFVGNALREGKNLIEIHLYSTLYNIIGPFHRPLGDVGNTFGGGYVNPDAAWLSVDTTVPDWEKKMDSFYPTWTDRYNVVPFGIRGVSIIL